MTAQDTVKFGGTYKESDEHVPDPTNLYAQLDTTGTGVHSTVEDVSPVFDVARANAAVQAARALDPEDPAVPESVVVFPPTIHLDEFDREAHIDRINAKAEHALAHPVLVGSPGSLQPEAAGGEDSKGDPEDPAVPVPSTSPASSTPLVPGDGKPSGKPGDKDASKPPKD